MVPGIIKRAGSLPAQNIKGIKMKVSELLKAFNGDRHPIVSAASLLGIHPNAIRAWDKKDGIVPVQWAALYREKAKEAKK